MSAQVVSPAHYAAALCAAFGVVVASVAAPAIGGHFRVQREATHNPTEGVPVIAGAKYGHTNLIAADWRRLARFYQEQF